MKTKIHNWYDAVKNRPLFGIMVYFRGKWHNAMREGRPMLFENESDRDKARAVLRDIPTPK